MRKKGKKYVSIEKPKNYAQNNWKQTKSKRLIKRWKTMKKLICQEKKKYLRIK